MDTMIATAVPSVATAFLTQESINAEEVSARFVEIIPIAYARQHRLIALDTGTPNKLTFVTTDPPDLEVVDIAANWIGVVSLVAIGSEWVIDAAINEAYSAQDSGLDSMVDSLRIDEFAEDGPLAAGNDGDLLDTASRAPVIKLVNMTLFEAIKRRASDVHVQPYADSAQVRLRIDGVLHDFKTLPRTMLDEIVSRIKVIGRMDIAEKRVAQDGRTTVTVGDRQVDLRISSLPTSHGERVVLRLLDKSARLYKLPELGMAQRDLDTFRRLIQHTHGIILVTGPTGSGKSTTLYAALQELNSRELNILTLEDPIEYQLEGISQTQVSDKKGMTFATGLRTVLRQDPDIIMVGEIRDEETARMAIQSSLTGHVVFSTLHTNDAASAVARLLDLGIEPYLVASSLLAVMAQRLIRQICPHCRKTLPLSNKERLRLGLMEDGSAEAYYGQTDPERHLAPLPPGHIAYGSGCGQCFDTGYYERIGIFELLEVTEGVRQKILSSGEASAIRQVSLAAGMTTLRQDALQKLFLGQTTVEEVLRVTTSDSLAINREGQR